MADTIDMRPARLGFKMRRGDDFAESITIKEGTPSVAVDVSARTYKAQVRTEEDSPDVVAEMTVDMTDAATGVIVISIQDAVTATMLGDYVWDLQQTVGGSVRTLLAGAFEVEADVTRSV